MLKQWRGSTDPAIESGEAVFQVFTNVPKVSMRLDAFADYFTISKLIDDARRLGAQEATANCKAKLKTLRETL